MYTAVCRFQKDLRRRRNCRHKVQRQLVCRQPSGSTAIGNGAAFRKEPEFAAWLAGIALGALSRRVTAHSAGHHESLYVAVFAKLDIEPELFSSGIVAFRKRD